MRIDEIDALLRSFDDVVVLVPQPGDGTPEIAWGDRFYSVAPDGVVPQTQPFATIVTKDYPGEPSSALDAEGAFRVNVQATAPEFERWAAGASGDPATRDAIMPHPVYAAQHWLCVVEPGPRSEADLRRLLVDAHGRARARLERRRDLH